MIHLDYRVQTQNDHQQDVTVKHYRNLGEMYRDLGRVADETERILGVKVADARVQIIETVTLDFGPESEPQPDAEPQAQV